MLPVQEEEPVQEETAEVKVGTQEAPQNTFPGATAQEEQQRVDHQDKERKHAELQAADH